VTVVVMIELDTSVDAPTLDPSNEHGQKQKGEHGSKS